METGPSHSAPWTQRLDHIVQTMRELSAETDPQRMVRNYARRMKDVFPQDGMVSLSRRGLAHPHVRITRSHRFAEEINPWKQPHKTPVLSGGILSDLIWGDLPVIIDDLKLASDDPAYEHLAGMRSLAAIPHYHQGSALNMVVHLKKDRGGFSREKFPELVLTSNLFGRATHNLVLSEQLQAAYDALDAEFQVVADIQRSLLPAALPEIPGLEIAVHYQTSRRAGGDYYDFFRLPGGHWGILLADVSGHGTPAAVVMAITHTIAHSHPGPPAPPELLMNFINQRLTGRSRFDTASFVTAFYAIFDPRSRTLVYSSAGHPPPRVRQKDGAILVLDEAQHLPLGILPGESYAQATIQLQAGDSLLLYTDGITETFDARHEMFGAERLEDLLRDHNAGPRQLVDAVLNALVRFSGNLPATDDRTVLAARVG